jgi:large subunit ribosomal protein L10
MLLFQHNNLRSSEWVGLRRELAIALRKIDAANVAAGRPSEHLADGIKLQIIQTGIFSTALKIVEFYKPKDPAMNSAADTPPYSSHGEELTHTLSRAAHDAIANMKTAHELDPLLSGPLVLLTFPTVSPQYLKAALSILAPSQPNFPAPKRRANPGWHDPAVQGGVQKLLLLGARVEGKVFDVEGTKWVGGIEGGLEGLRGQLVAMLQSIGGGITSTLESAGKSLYFTMEGRRGMLEDEEKGTSGESAKDETKAD